MLSFLTLLHNFFPFIARTLFSVVMLFPPPQIYKFYHQILTTLPQYMSLFSPRSRFFFPSFLFLSSTVSILVCNPHHYAPTGFGSAIFFIVAAVNKTQGSFFYILPLFSHFSFACNPSSYLIRQKIHWWREICCPTYVFTVFVSLGDRTLPQGTVIGSVSSARSLPSSSKLSLLFIQSTCIISCFFATVIAERTYWKKELSNVECACRVVFLLIRKKIDAIWVLWHAFPSQ